MSCIMIVDDDIDDIDLFVEAVYEVEPLIKCISAQNGLEAISLINSISEKPDFIFVDLNMPKLNGKQFIKEMRKDASLNHIKIIIYSTSRLEKDEKETRELGADEFIPKPTSMIELCDEIARVITKEYLPH